MTYQAAASSGVRITIKAKTLAGAKREASKWITFDGGSVTIYSDGQPVAYKRFWQYGNKFGWDKWISL